MNGSTEQGTVPTAEEVRKAAIAVTAEHHPEAQTILDKQARGEKLNAREWGIVGFLRKKFGGGSDAPGKPTPAGNGNAPRVEPGPSAETKDESLADPPADPGIVRRTTASIIARLEARDKRRIAALCDDARGIGAEPKTLARIERAAGLPVDDKALLQDLTPDVFREWGIDPRKYATGICLAVFGLWRWEMWEAVDELRTIVNKPKEQPPAEPPKDA